MQRASGHERQPREHWPAVGASQCRADLVGNPSRQCRYIHAGRIQSSAAHHSTSTDRCSTATTRRSSTVTSVQPFAPVSFGWRP